MSVLSDFKTKNPQYKDVPDAKLADALHSKYYAAIPKDQYYAKIGFDPAMDAAHVDATKEADRGVGFEVYQGITADYGDELDALLVQPVVMAKNLATEATGGKPKYTSSQFAEALKDEERKGQAQFESEHPIVATGANVGGQVLGALGVGKALGALGLGAKAATGAQGASKAAQLVKGVGTSALVGGAMNAADASGRATGGPAERAKAAAEGFGPGALTGGALHLGGAGVKALAPVADRLTGHVVSEGARSAEDFARKTLKMPPNTKPSPTQVAAARRLMGNADVTEAEKKVAAENAKRAAVGAPAAKAYDSDIASQRTKGTLKTAAEKLEDKSALKTERESVEKDLGAKTKARTEKAMPSTIKPGEEAPHRASRLKRERHDEATTKYEPHYAKEVQPHESVMAVLKSPAGQSALKTYRAEAEMLSHDLDAGKAAIGRRAMDDIDNIGQYYEDIKARETAQRQALENPHGIPEIQPSKDTMDMVDKLKAQGTPRGDQMAKTILEAHGFKPVEVPPEPPVPNVTLRTLDEIKQFTNRESEKPFGGNESVQGAYKGLGNVIDQHLAEPLKDARQAYHQKSLAIEAAEMGGDLFNKTPAEVAHSLTEKTATPLDDLSKLPAEAQDSLRVNARDQILGAIKTPDKSANLLNRIATDEKAQAMLKALFGDKEAQSYIDASEIMLKDAQAIEQVSPADKPIQKDETADALHKGAAMATWMHKAPEILTSWALKHGITMSAQEARAVEQLGLGKPEDLVKIIKENPEAPFSNMVYTLLGRTLLTAGNEGQASAPLDEGQAQDQQPALEPQP